MDNIEPEHFKHIMLPNTQNSDVLNIYLFYREAEFIKGTEFYNFLDEIDLKKIIYTLFEIPAKYSEEYLNKIQKHIIKFDFNKFNKEEQLELKWLLYDCNNVNGKKLVINNERFISKSRLYVYFTDSALKEKIKKELKNTTLGFLENDSESIKYLKFINKQNCDKCYTFHKFVISNGKVNQYSKNKNDVIDHNQRPPEYFYDLCLWDNQNNTMRKIKNEIKKEELKEMIYYKIIESWRRQNRLIINRKPQVNNCFDNLKELNESINKGLKCKMIDKSEIIYPRSTKNNKMCIYFYFPKTQNLKINNISKRIVALSIIYNLNEIKYDDIIKELRDNIYDNNELEFDQRINYNKLFEYIKGKDILYMVEDLNDTTQKGILIYKDFFDTKTKNVKMIKNYNK